MFEARLDGEKIRRQIICKNNKWQNVWTYSTILVLPTTLYASDKGFWNYLIKEKLLKDLDCRGWNT